MQFKALAARMLLIMIGLVVLTIMFVAVVVGLAVAIVLVPIFALVSFVRRGLGIRPASRGYEKAPSCPACGFSLGGQGSRGVCPSCNTVFGFDTEVRHEVVEVVQLPPAETRPDSDDRR